MILFVPNIVYANEIDAIDQIDNYRLERENNLIESTNDLAATTINIQNEEPKAETNIFKMNNMFYLLLAIPTAGLLIMYTLIIKNKEV